MKLRDLKKLIEDEDNLEAFKKFVNGAYDEKDEPTKIGDYEFNVILNERCNSEQEFIFSVDGCLYRLLGSYCSWNGISWDDITDFKEVEAVEVKKIEYRDKK